MNEIMDALRIKDNKTVSVERISKIMWRDTETGKEYILHIDIELLY